MLVPVDITLLLQIGQALLLLVGYEIIRALTHLGALTSSVDKEST